MSMDGCIQHVNSQPKVSQPDTEYAYIKKNQVNSGMTDIIPPPYSRGGDKAMIQSIFPICYMAAWCAQWNCHWQVGEHITLLCNILLLPLYPGGQSRQYTWNVTTVCMKTTHLYYTKKAN